MDIEKVINKNLIKLDLKAKNKEEAIKELANLLDNEGCLIDKEEYLKSVYHRESISSTFCGYSVAIPHGITKAVRKPSLCFGRTSGFNWDIEDDETFVEYVYLIAIPETQDKSDESIEHLNILSTIATLTLEDEIREKWETVKTPEEFLETLR